MQGKEIKINFKGKKSYSKSNRTNDDKLFIRKREFRSKRKIRKIENTRRFISLGNLSPLTETKVNFNNNSLKFPSEYKLIDIVKSIYPKIKSLLKDEVLECVFDDNSDFCDLFDFLINKLEKKLNFTRYYIKKDIKDYDIIFLYSYNIPEAGYSVSIKYLLSENKQLNNIIYDCINYLVNNFNFPIFYNDYVYESSLGYISETLMESFQEDIDMIKDNLEINEEDKEEAINEIKVKMANVKEDLIENNKMEKFIRKKMNKVVVKEKLKRRINSFKPKNDKEKNIKGMLVDVSNYFDMKEIDFMNFCNDEIFPVEYDEPENAIMPYQYCSFYWDISDAEDYNIENVSQSINFSLNEMWSNFGAAPFTFVNFNDKIEEIPDHPFHIITIMDIFSNIERVNHRA